MSMSVEPKQPKSQCLPESEPEPTWTWTTEPVIKPGPTQALYQLHDPNFNADEDDFAVAAYYAHSRELKRITDAVDEDPRAIIRVDKGSTSYWYRHVYPTSMYEHKSYYVVHDDPDKEITIGSYVVFGPDQICIPNVPLRVEAIDGDYLVVNDFTRVAIPVEKSQDQAYLRDGPFGNGVYTTCCAEARNFAVNFVGKGMIKSMSQEEFDKQRIIVLNLMEDTVEQRHAHIPQGLRQNPILKALTK